MLKNYWTFKLFNRRVFKLDYNFKMQSKNKKQEAKSIAGNFFDIESSDDDEKKEMPVEPKKTDKKPQKGGKPEVDEHGLMKFYPSHFIGIPISCPIAIANLENLQAQVMADGGYGLQEWMWLATA